MNSDIRNERASCSKDLSIPFILFTFLKGAFPTKAVFRLLKDLKKKLKKQKTFIMTSFPSLFPSVTVEVEPMLNSDWQS